MDDGSVEEAESGSATTEVLHEFRTLQSARSPIVLDDHRLRSTFEAEGFRLVGERRCPFQSGTLFQQATLLLEVAKRANSTRDALLEASGGREPSGFDQWVQWYEATTSVGAACSGSRVLALAAVEAFVNEILTNQHPEVARKLKGAGLITKLRTLCELRQIATDVLWLRTLTDAQKSRSEELVHFKPTCQDAADLDVLPLATSDHPADVERLIAAIQAMHKAVFGSYGLPVFPTHLTWRQSAEANWIALGIGRMKQGRSA
jgi:hypothetical protein